MNETPLNPVIVAGSREFTDYWLLVRECDKFLRHVYPHILHISGGARGADLLGEKWARVHKYKSKVFVADWDRFGKGAGPIRNREMAEFARDYAKRNSTQSSLIAFLTTESKGTKSMIEIANEFHIDHIHIVKV